MAGNKRRQRAFQIPLLIEIAVVGGQADVRRWGRRKSDSKTELLNWVMSFFKFTATERKERHARSGQLVIENDVMWAFKLLQEAGEVRRAKDEFWEITDGGLLRLREYLTSLLRNEISDDEVDKLMMQRNYNDQELLLQALQFVGTDSIRQANDSLSIMVLGADSLRHLFRNAVANIPLPAIGEFVCYEYEVFKPFVSRHLAQRHHLSAAA